MPLRSGEGISGWCAHAAATRWRTRISARSWCARMPLQRDTMGHSRECAELARTHAAATRWRTRISARSWCARMPLQRDGALAQVRGVGPHASRRNAVRWHIRVSARSWPARQPLQRTDCARAGPANQPAIPAPGPQSVNGIAPSPAAVHAAGPQKFHMQITLVLQQSILKCDILIGVDAVSEGEANAVEHSDSG